MLTSHDVMLPWARRLIYLIATTTLVCLAVYAYLRGATEEITPYAIVYHVVNYGDGLIRRGLPGEILSWIVEQKDLAAVKSAANRVYIVLQVVFAVSLFAWVFSIDLRRKDYLVFGLFAVFLASQFVPTLALDNTYLDVYLYILLIVAAVGFARGLPILIAVAGAIGPFIHESFVFCWLTIAILVLWDRVSLARILLLCVPLVSTGVIYLGTSPAPITAQLMASALSEEDKQHGLVWQFGQTAALDFDLMIVKLRHYPLNLAIAFVFFTLPAVISVGVYGAVRRSWLDTVVLTVAALAPLTILLLAWDLSRFLVGANFFAFVAILYMETVRPAPLASWQAPILCSVVGLLLIQIPFVYAYFDVANVEDRGSLSLRTWPLGRLTLAGTQYFNRYIGPQFVAEVGHQDPPGDTWYVEENGWRGMWLRRPGTNIFDAGMTMGGVIGRNTILVERSGNTIIARRSDGPDLTKRRFDYSGTLDGNIIDGTYPGGRWIVRIH